MLTASWTPERRLTPQSRQQDALPGNTPFLTQPTPWLTPGNTPLSLCHPRVTTELQTGPPRSDPPFPPVTSRPSQSSWTAARPLPPPYRAPRPRPPANTPLSMPQHHKRQVRYQYSSRQSPGLLPIPRHTRPYPVFARILAPFGFRSRSLPLHQHCPPLVPPHQTRHPTLHASKSPPTRPIRGHHGTFTRKTRIDDPQRGRNPNTLPFASARCCRRPQTLTPSPELSHLNQLKFLFILPRCSESPLNS